MKNLAIGFILILLAVSCELDTMNTTSNNHASETFEVVYGNHPLQSFRLITPENSDQNTKVAVLIHGGGWVMGYHPDEKVTTFSGRYNWDLESPLLQQGIAVVTMKYRTACYNTQPDLFNNNTTFYIDRMVEDINLVVEDLISNAEDYRINSNQVQLVGESGGGHIVMYYGINSAAKEEVRSVVSMFGPTDLDAQDFKDIIYDVPLLNVPPPNYFLRQAENCASVTNKQVRTWSSLKSFSDHNEISVNQPNEFLDTLSTSFAPNLSNNIAMYITHGVDDELVPFTQATEMMAAMQNKFGASACDDSDFSCHLKLGAYDNCGHGWIGGDCLRNTVVSDIVSWLQAH